MALTCFKAYEIRDVFERIFKGISGTPDFESAMIDGTIVRAHQTASGARRTHDQATGRSRGGLTNKTLVLIDALENLAEFVFLPGQAHDMKDVEPLIDSVDFDALLSNKEFDADWLLAELNVRGTSAIKPRKANRKILLDYDKYAYKWRCLIDNCFAQIKELRAIANRHEKTAPSCATISQQSSSDHDEYPQTLEF